MVRVAPAPALGGVLCGAGAACGGGGWLRWWKLGRRGGGAAGGAGGNAPEAGVGEHACGVRCRRPQARQALRAEGRWRGRRGGDCGGSCGLPRRAPAHAHAWERRSVRVHRCSNNRARFSAAAAHPSVVSTEAAEAVFASVSSCASACSSMTATGRACRASWRHSAAPWWLSRHVTASASAAACGAAPSASARVAKASQCVSTSNHLRTRAPVHRRLQSMPFDSRGVRACLTEERGRRGAPGDVDSVRLHRARHLGWRHAAHAHLHTHTRSHEHNRK